VSVADTQATLHVSVADTQANLQVSVDCAVGHKSKSRLARCHLSLDWCPGGLISTLGLAADFGTWPSSAWPKSTSRPIL
ncbi:hypothetical protein VP01_1505g5, partial [Puccinia sorghi]